MGGFRGHDSTVLPGSIDRRSLFGLDADDAGIRAQAVPDDCSAGGSAAQPDRNEDGIHIVHVFKDLDGICPDAPNQIRGVSGVDEREIPLFRQFGRLMRRFIIILTVDHQLGPEVSHPRVLLRVIPFGNTDDRGRSEKPSGVSNRKTVISPCSADHAPASRLLRQTMKIVDSAPDFKCADGKMILVLDIYLEAQNPSRGRGRSRSAFGERYRYTASRASAISSNVTGRDEMRTTSLVSHHSDLRIRPTHWKPSHYLFEFRKGSRGLRQIPSIRLNARNPRRSLVVES